MSKGVGIHVVGLADSAVRDSLLRTVTAIQSKGFVFPGKKVIINLAPADLCKTGTGYDLPIALSLIAESHQDKENLNDLEEWMTVGELGLDGSVREVPGCIQAVREAIEMGCKGVVIPAANGPEVASVFGRIIPVYGVSSLDEAIAAIGGMGTVPTVWEVQSSSQAHRVRPQRAWDQLVGNIAGKRAIEIAAAGGHPLLLMGAPGSGRTTLARALRELLPPMDIDETLEVASIYSASGRGETRTFTNETHTRPFRSPHYSASLAALFGGGNGDSVQPGELSLASKGILYIDEVNLLPRAVNEALHSVLRERKLVISRLRSKVVFPADIQFVGAMNPCPCGYYGEGDRCNCSQRERELWLASFKEKAVYQSFDIQAWVHPASGQESVSAGKVETESVEVVAQRVRQARERQARRYAGDVDIRLNVDLKAADTDVYCHLDDECLALLDKITERLGLSCDVRLPVIRLARTIADLADEDNIKPEHLCEAASYRFLDRETH